MEVTATIITHLPTDLMPDTTTTTERATTRTTELMPGTTTRDVSDFPR